MEKIVKELLKIKFPEANIENLVEIIEATPDAVVATEILTGLYERPLVNNTPDPDVFKPRYKNVEEVHNPTLIKFNPFTGDVEYKYNRKECRTIYIHKDSLEMEAITYDDIKDLSNGMSHTVNDCDIYKGSWIEDYLSNNNIPKDDPEKGLSQWKKILLYGEPLKKTSTDNIALDKWQ